MRLVIEDEAGTRTVVPFSADELVIGRGTEGVAWRLPDRNVSRRHARFTQANGNIFVEDLGSLIGTRLNGERIDSRRRVRPGDLVEIGAYDLAVLPEDLAVAGPGAPPPLPALTRPDPMPVVKLPGSTAQAGAAPAAAAGGGPGPAGGGTSARLARLARIGAVALLGGLLAGLLLRRWLS